MARKIKLSHIAPELVWARDVVRDLGEKEARKLVRWWKGKDAKLMWGTDKAAKNREALKKVIEETYG